MSIYLHFSQGVNETLSYNRKLSLISYTVVAQKQRETYYFIYNFHIASFAFHLLFYQDCKLWLWWTSYPKYLRNDNFIFLLYCSRPKEMTTANCIKFRIRKISNFLQRCLSSTPITITRYLFDFFKT